MAIFFHQNFESFIDISNVLCISVCFALQYSRYTLAKLNFISVHACTMKVDENYIYIPEYHSCHMHIKTPKVIQQKACSIYVTKFFVGAGASYQLWQRLMHMYVTGLNSIFFMEKNQSAKKKLME